MDFDFELAIGSEDPPPIPLASHHHTEDDEEHRVWFSDMVFEIDDTLVTQPPFETFDGLSDSHSVILRVDETEDEMSADDDTHVDEWDIGFGGSMGCIWLEDVDYPTDAEDNL
jgi:hypothetical protein